MNYECPLSSSQNLLDADVSLSTSNPPTNNTDIPIYNLSSPQFYPLSPVYQDIRPSLLLLLPPPLPPPPLHLHLHLLLSSNYSPKQFIS
jgi:hypothetical protein